MLEYILILWDSTTEAARLENRDTILELDRKKQQAKRSLAMAKRRRQAGYRPSSPDTGDTTEPDDSSGTDDSEDEEWMQKFIAFKDEEVERQRQRRLEEELALVRAEEEHRLKEEEDRKQMISKIAIEEFKAKVAAEDFERQKQNREMREKMETQLIQLAPKLGLEGDRIREALQDVELHPPDSNALVLMRRPGEVVAAEASSAATSESGVEPKAAGRSRNSLVLR